MNFTEFIYSGLYGVMTEKGKPNSVLFILFTVACIIIPYLLGSLNFAVIISKLKYKDDIRNHGSGNAGMTNMLRTYGKGPAVCTLAGDMLKGVFAVIIGCVLLGHDLGGYMAGFFAIIGHMFPVFYRFKGGKGVATTAALMLVLNPVVFLIILFVFLVIVIGTKYVSLGSVMSAMLYPVVLHNFSTFGTDVIFSFLIAAMVVFMHRSNIKRLMNGTESKISLGKKKEDKK